ncbi:hypothetical protein like AT1G08790 [Hibiscus trionum]|uniref:Uncharacterized protein n=1 Tax=Hibiscus trionum TaxID=183268 RepID=A0A9W7J9I7_HIBTR|nr:hypothetical protein like AT1G08790 [Hibiscus trionum]
MAKDNRSITTTKVTKSSPSLSLCDSETKDLQRNARRPPPLKVDKRVLSKQLSMLETSREIAWERRRRQILRQERRKKGVATSENGLTDEDLNELKGCIELGFGFNEEEGQKLCNTLPALDLYFAVNRQLSPLPSPQNQGYLSPAPSPSRPAPLPSPAPSPARPSPAPSPCLTSPKSEADWKIYSPGENPQQVKTRIRHWAQAVACSLKQSC